MLKRRDKGIRTRLNSIFAIADARDCNKNPQD